jgi:hypothetical protein
VTSLAARSTATVGVVALTLFGVPAASTPAAGGRIAGTVTGAGGEPQASAPVRACPQTGPCVVGLSAADGTYAIEGLPAGDWQLTALPPAGSVLLPGAVGPIAVRPGAAIRQDLALRPPGAPPAGVTVSDRGTTERGIPLVAPADDVAVDVPACPGGSATYRAAAGAVTRAGGLTEAPRGSYHALIPALRTPGEATVTVAVDCPAGPDLRLGFTIHIGQM